TMLMSESRVATSGSLRISAIAADSLSATAGNVPGGAAIAHHEVTTKPGSTSVTVGTSGSDGLRSALETASARSVPSDILVRRCKLPEHDVDVAGDQVGQRRTAAAIWHVADSHARHRLEQLAGQMRGGADALGGIVELVGIRLRIGDQLLQARGRHFRM